MGVRPGDRVCLVVGKSAAAVLAMHAVLKAGGVYVPIDLASPPRRIEHVLRASEPRVVLAGGTAAGLVDQLSLDRLEPPPTVGLLDRGSSDSPVGWAFSLADADAYPADAGLPRGAQTDAAHLLFTSGSTGVPKGVPVTHRSVIAFVDWATAYFGIGPDDRLSGHSPFHFDLSTFDVFGSLAAGSELHLVPPSLNLSPRKLVEFIGRAQLTQWFSVPSAMTLVATFDALAGVELTSLRRVIWCGEVLPTPTLIHWMERVPHARFTNLYGPTETTIASSYYTLPRPPASEHEPLPIGRPCAGEELLLLDDELRPVPVGESGHVYIAGVGLSPGYWRDEEATTRSFVADPRRGRARERLYRTGDLGRVSDDGLFYFLGRTDAQIKSRGHRIELGEVEAAVNSVAGVRECAVVGVPTGGFEGTAIGCAYAAGDVVDLDPVRMKEKLRELLPAYMIPARWLVLNALPKNANGKIDRARLKDLFAEGARV